MAKLLIENNQFTLELGDWEICHEIDDDGHLNVYIMNNDGTNINEVDSERGNGKDGEQLALRFTTDGIEKEYDNNN